MAVQIIDFKLFDTNGEPVTIDSADQMEWRPTTFMQLDGIQDNFTYDTTNNYIRCDIGDATLPPCKFRAKIMSGDVVTKVSNWIYL